MIPIVVQYMSTVYWPTVRIGVITITVEVWEDVLGPSRLRRGDEVQNWIYLD